MITLYTPWHSIGAHFGVGIPVFASVLALTGILGKVFGKDEFAKKLTLPLHAFAFLSMIVITIAFAGALIDFPGLTFKVSPFFRTKVILAIIAFFVYAGMYYTVMLKKEDIWKSGGALTYLGILALIGLFLISSLGAIGGYLGKGHTVLIFVLKFFNLV